jgi:hypothetical protein
MMPDSLFLRRAAERVRSQPFYLAAALLDWAEREGWDDAALAARLGCAPKDLAGVLLCRRPVGTGPQFRHDVERIAERFGLEPLRLAEAIRYADALGETAAEAEPGWLAAARDRGPEVDLPPAESPQTESPLEERS